VSTGKADELEKLIPRGTAETRTKLKDKQKRATRARDSTMMALKDLDERTSVRCHAET
jgi:hypothetical protein